jgi:hypothetical protein
MEFCMLGHMSVITIKVYISPSVRLHNALEPQQNIFLITVNNLL